MKSGQRRRPDGSAATGPEPAVYVRIVGGLAGLLIHTVVELLRGA